MYDPLLGTRHQVRPRVPWERSQAWGLSQELRLIKVMLGTRWLTGTGQKEIVLNSSMSCFGSVWYFPNLELPKDLSRLRNSVLWLSLDSHDFFPHFSLFCSCLFVFLLAFVWMKQDKWAKTWLKQGNISLLRLRGEQGLFSLHCVSIKSYPLIRWWESVCFFILSHHLLLNDIFNMLSTIWKKNLISKPWFIFLPQWIWVSAIHNRKKYI